MRTVEEARRQGEIEHRKRVKFHHSRTPFGQTGANSPLNANTNTNTNTSKTNSNSYSNNSNNNNNGSSDRQEMRLGYRQKARRNFEDSPQSDTPSSIDVIDIDGRSLHLRASVNSRRLDANLFLHSVVGDQRVSQAAQMQMQMQTQTHQGKSIKYGTSRHQVRYHLANPPLLMGLIQLHHLCANMRRDGNGFNSDSAASHARSLVANANANANANADPRKRNLGSAFRLQLHDDKWANSLVGDSSGVYERQVLSPTAADKRASAGNASLPHAHGPMALPHLTGRRRESFLYREEMSDRESRLRRSSATSQPQAIDPANLMPNAFSGTGSKPVASARSAADDKQRPSAPADLRLLDEPIVTPFAQILATLHSVRAKYSSLAHLPKRQHKSHGVHSSIDENEVQNEIDSERSDPQRQEAAEILEAIDWCLDQLETVQAHRSLSDLASSKFKRLLKKELSQFTEAGTGSQVADYISNTYTDKQEEEIDNSSPNADGEAGSQKANGDDFRNNAGERAAIAEANRRDADASSEQVGELTVAVGRMESVNNMSAISTVESGTGVLADSKLSPASNDAQLSNAFVKPFIGRMAASLEAAKRCQLVNGKPRFSNWTDEDVIKIDTTLASVNDWGLDIFKLHDVTDGHPLVSVVFSILEHRGLISKMKINPFTLLKYLVVVEGHYHRDIPYHTCIHAADVTQSTHVMLSASRFQNAFTDLEVFAAIMASAIHDTDHPGVTNQFLINTGSDLATMYNDESVLENHHLAVSFKILQEADLDFLHGHPNKLRSQYRRLVIDMVLATDMSKHMALLADLKTMVEAKTVARLNEVPITLDTFSDKILIMKNLIHCADLSNPAKPLAIYQVWVDRIMEEFFRQGDLERSKGLDISPMCDRLTATVAKSQVGFIDFIVHPLWETWAELVYPDGQPMLDYLAENREWYKQQAA